MINNILLKILNLQAASKSNRPELVMRALKVAAGEVIADIGSGGGEYTYRFAHAIGKEGKVYAVDVDQRYLDYVARRARAKGLSNVVTHLTSGSELILPENSIDLVFMRDVFHDIELHHHYFTNMHKALKPGGTVAIIDFLNDGKSIESVTGHCTNESTILTTMQACKFRHEERLDFLAKQSFNLFTKD